MAAFPDALKSIKPFIKRAQEVERSANPSAAVIAYYCRAYAMQKAIDAKVQSEPGVQEYLLGMMTELEEAQKTLPVGKADAKEIVRNFSLGVFKKADDEYRAGRATKGTAKSFYAAGSFLEVNKHFDEGEEADHELDNLRKYAKMKATEIVLAIKQGKKPLPPEMQNEQEATEEEEQQEEEAQINIMEEEVPKHKPVIQASIEPAPNVVQTKGLKDNVDEDKEPAPLPKAELAKKKKRHTRLRPRGEQGNAQTKEAEAHARQAVRSIESEKFQEAANSLGMALSVLETRKPKTKVNEKRVTESIAEDALEFAYFAVRSLECIGDTIDLEEGIDLATNHLSDALTLLQTS